MGSTYEDLISRAHALYRTLSSATEWTLLAPEGVPSDFSAYLGNATLKLEGTIRGSGVETEEHENAPLSSSRLGAVLDGVGVRQWDPLFVETALVKRLDERSVIRRLHARAHLSLSAKKFAVVTQVVATSSTYVSVSSSIPEDSEGRLEAQTSDGELPVGQVELLAWTIAQAPESGALNITCFYQPSSKDWSSDHKLLKSLLCSSVAAAALHLEEGGFPLDTIDKTLLPSDEEESVDGSDDDKSTDEESNFGDSDAEGAEISRGRRRRRDLANARAFSAPSGLDETLRARALAKRKSSHFQRPAAIHTATPDISLPIYPSRFSSEITRAYQLFNALLSDPDGFRPVGTQKDIAMYRKDVAGHPVGVLKGEDLYKQTLTFLLLCVVLDEITGDSQFESAELIEQLSPVSLLSHVTFKAIWPTSQRDATVVTATTSSSRRYQFVTTSVAGDPALPPVKNGVVRAHVDIAGWDVEEVASINSDEESSIRITYIAQMPLMVAAVVDYLRDYPPPPCLLNIGRGTTITRLNFDQDTSVYSLSLKAGDGDEERDPCAIEIRLDRRWDKDVDAKYVAADGGEGPGTVECGIDSSYGEGAVVFRIMGSGIDEREEAALSICRGEPETGMVVNGRHIVVAPKLPANSASEVPSTPPSEPLPILSKSVSETVDPRSSLAPSPSKGIWGSPAGPSAGMSSSMWFDRPTDAPSDTTQNVETPSTTTTPQVPIPVRPSDLDRTRQLYNTAETALSRLVRLQRDTEEWGLVSIVKSGLAVYRKTSEMGGLPNVPLFKGVKVVEGFSPEEVHAVVRSFHCRKTWDETFEDGKFLEYCGDGVHVSYATLKGFFPISRRDLITVSMDKLIPATSGGTALPTIFSATTSITEDLLSAEAQSRVSADLSPSKTRAHLVISGWVLEPIDPYEDPNHHPIPSTRATCFYKLDLCGAVPHAAHAVLVGSVPRCPASIETYLKEHGPLPYVRWPGPSRRIGEGLSSSDDRGREDEAARDRPPVQRNREDVRVVREEVDHKGAEFAVGFEASWPASRISKDAGRGDGDDDGTETFHMEMEDQVNEVGGAGSRTFNVHAEDLVLELTVDISRWPSGYSVTWVTEEGGTSGRAGPDLKIEVVEIPPPPTHSATHFRTDEGGEGGGVAGEGGSGVSAELSSGTLKNRQRSMSSNGGPPNGVTKHAVRVYVVPSDNDAATSPSSPRPDIASDGPRDRFYRLSEAIEAAGGGRWFRGTVRLTFTEAKKEGAGIGALWGVAVPTIAGEFGVKVNGKRVEIGKVADWREKAKLARRVSRASRDSLRGSSTSAGLQMLLNRKSSRHFRGIPGADDGDKPDLNDIKPSSPPRFTSLLSASLTPNPVKLPTPTGLPSSSSQLTAPTDPGHKDTQTQTTAAQPAAVMGTPPSDTQKFGGRAASPARPAGGGSSSISSAHTDSAGAGAGRVEVRVRRDEPTSVEPTYALGALVLYGLFWFILGCLLRLWLVDPFTVRECECYVGERGMPATAIDGRLVLQGRDDEGP
ncbi:hypothetical protein HK104_004991 [Borealophlyctis nickersoniae]|nr:hypothetical protein HK104_004991 [Borealophlyctis nickersoniae]